MVGKRKGSRERTRGQVPRESTWAALAPHVDSLVAAAAERAAQIQAEVQARAQIEAERSYRLDEAGLMTLIFAHLDDDNPRVCVGIDFERLMILDEARVAPEPAPLITTATEPPAPTIAEPPVEPRPSRNEARMTNHTWTGRDWIDEIRAIDPAMLDRPELDIESRALLERARARLLPTLNLRRLEREPALAHLELFVRACQQQRARFARVITGKGIESRAEPVLKRAVLGWCHDAGLVSAPELDNHGEWGALIVELNRSS